MTLANSFSIAPQAPGTAKPRLDWVDAGKGLSIILVVVYHAASLMDAAGIRVPLMLTLNASLADLRMPTFFLLSGLFARKWVLGGWRALIENKILLFAWVYAVWTVLELPTKWASMAAITHEVGEGFWLKQLALLAASPVRAPGPIWFIWALLLFFTFAKLTSRWPLWLQFSLAGGASLLYRSLPDGLSEQIVQVTGLGWRGVLVNYVFFLLGCYFSVQLRGSVGRVPPAAAAAVVALWAALWSAALWLDLNRIGLVRFAMAFCGLAAGLGLAVLLRRVGVLSWLGSRTLPIYLAHYPFLILLAIGAAHVLPGVNQLGATILVLVATGAAVALCLSLYALRTYRPISYLFVQPPWLTLALRRNAPSMARRWQDAWRPVRSKISRGPLAVPADAVATS